METSTETRVRDAREADVPAMLGLCRELAVFEKLDHLMTMTPERLREDIFGNEGNEPKCRALVAERNGELVGYAVYNYIYFTFTGRWLYLDDLYVTPAVRGSGAGKALLARVTDDAIAASCAGAMWFVLDWNTPAQRFYAAMGAEMQSDWYQERVRGLDALRAFSMRLKQPKA